MPQDKQISELPSLYISEPRQPGHVRREPPRLEARRSSSLSPPHTPTTLLAGSSAYSRHSVLTVHRAQKALAVSSYSGSPSKICGSAPRHLPLSIHRGASSNTLRRQNETGERVDLLVSLSLERVQEP